MLGRAFPEPAPERRQHVVREVRAEPVGRAREARRPQLLEGVGQNLQVKVGVAVDGVGAARHGGRGRAQEPPGPDGLVRREKIGGGGRRGVKMADREDVAGEPYRPLATRSPAGLPLTCGVVKLLSALCVATRSKRRAWRGGGQRGARKCGTREKRDK